MFGIDFYPTPEAVVERMLAAVPVTGKTILEPSAGAGNIVNYLNASGAKQVLACEIDSRLRKVLSGKCDIIAYDFLELTAIDVSHIDLIIMNPPFSNQEKHILHAWDIAPAGCQIVSLCNATMLENRYSRQRTEIAKLAEAHGRCQVFGKCFDKAERETGVSVGCIWMHKPGTADSEFEGYFDLYDYEQDEVNQSGIVRYDFVQDIVSRYVEAVSMFDEVEAANDRINRTIRGVVEGFNITFGARKYGRDNEYKSIDRQTFKKELQKAAWRRLFGMMNMEKYVTTGVMADINKFVEQQETVPFTVRNVYLMIQMIAGTHGQRMDKVIVEAFETICGYSYENSTAGEGWRTNTDFLINKRFILPHIGDYDQRWPTDEVKISYRYSDTLNDIVKALCHLTATNYEHQIGLREFCQYRYHIKDDDTGLILNHYDFRYSDRNRACDRLEGMKRAGRNVSLHIIDNRWGEWIEWGFFRVKFFKKGTMHAEFISDDLWQKFNQRVAEIKGWKNMVTHTTKGRKAKGK
jgi:predicted RNA methylase